MVLLMLCLLNSGRFIDSASLSYDFGDFYKSGIELESGGLFGMALGTWLTKLTGESRSLCFFCGCGDCQHSAYREHTGIQRD